MGRAMLILAAGAIIVFGMVQLGLLGQKEILYKESADYATDYQAKNTAFTAIQLAMEKINQDDTWNPTQGNKWNPTIEGVEVEFYYDVISTGATSLDPDTIRVYSVGIIRDQDGTVISRDSIISTFSKQSLNFVPEFEAALSIATDNFTFSMGGSASISGNEATGACSDRPAITVQDEDSAEEIVGPDGIVGVVTGDDNTEQMESSVEDVQIDASLSYSPVDELVARLSNLPGSQTISGNYKGSLGTQDDPGVFFVENYAKLTGGISAGYGIMVIRSGGELEYEGELSVAGNFEFNGLIIFENAFDFTGRGTPDLNGSVLVGNTPGNNDVIDIDISGNLGLQYDCTAEKYAQKASASLLKQNRYTRLNTFE